MNSDFCVAVHALVYLNHKKELCSSEQLSGNICTHPARVRRIMTKLRKQKLVDAEDNGPKGGYRFTKDPDVVTLSDIASALGVTFVSSAWSSGNTDMTCLIASGMGMLMDGIFQEMNTLCYDHLKSISISDLDHRLFNIKSTDT